MKSCISIIILACCVISGNTQSLLTAEDLMLHQDNMEEQVKKISFPSSKQKVHRLYLNVRWQNSAVVTTAGDILYFNGRYSVLDKSIEVNTSEGVRVITPDRVKAAMIGRRYFDALPKEEIKEQSNGLFLEALSVGAINLYAKHYLKSRMTGSNTLTTSSNGEKEYYIADDLYYYVPGTICLKLKGKKKILALFTDQKDIVEQYVKDQKLKFNSKEDLIKIFNFYNELRGE